MARTPSRSLGRAGGDTLTREGFAAHEASAELQELARANTPAGLKQAARAERRFWLDVVLLVALLGFGLVWSADNVIGYAASSTRVLPVASAGMARQQVRLPNGHGAAADCWRSGGVEAVWKAAPPVAWALPYRCGNRPADVVMPGPLSAGAALIAIFAAFLLLAARRRRLRLAWY